MTNNHSSGPQRLAQRTVRRASPDAAGLRWPFGPEPSRARQPETTWPAPTTLRTRSARDQNGARA